MAIDQFYSKKVLDHVKHPRNMGEIKDADGVATVGNPVCGDIMRLFIKVEKNQGEEKIKDIKFQTLGCLPPEEEIVSANGGWKRIEEVPEGDIAINSDGRETEIVKTFTREYDGSLLVITPFVSPFNSFSVTPDHPVLCVKRIWVKGARRSSSLCDWLRLGEEKLLNVKPDYVKAESLQRADFLVFPINHKVVDNKLFTKKLMKLLGYYLSEGYITGGNVVNFAFGQHETRLIKEVKKLFLEITGKQGSQRTRNGVTELRFCSKKWADFIYSLCGRLARGKTLSLKVLLLPFDKQWEMIKTFILGDGDTYKRRSKDSQTYRMTTTSKDLAIQLQEMLARGGIFSSIRKILKTNCKIGGRRLRDSVQYLISFKLQKKHRFVHKGKNYFLVPIRKIETKNFRGFVYNLQTAFEPNSYLVRGFAVHNCGAAIATSSMITTMVKGKPLNEAEKITKETIAEALGGLPPVKLHCSVLAADALKKAIEDYRKKK